MKTHEKVEGTLLHQGGDPFSAAKGWVKLHRSLAEWCWFSEPRTLQVFIYLLIHANYETRQWRDIVLRRGELIIGTHKLAKELDCTRQVIRTRLERLEACGSITITTTNKYSIVSICNYDKYQTIPSENSPHGNQQKATIQEGIRRQNFKKESPLTPQGGNGLLSYKKESFPIDQTLAPFAPNPQVAPDPLSPAFEKWLAYKQEKRQSYRSDSALRACYNRLQRYSKGDPKVAMEIIDQSIAMNYSGFFEPTKRFDKQPESIANASEAEQGTRYSTI